MPYIYSSIIGIILGWLLCQAAVLSSFIGGKNILQIIFPIFGGVIGVFIVHYLYLKKKTIYTALSKKLWLLPFLHANLFFGVSLGLVAGSFFVWIILSNIFTYFIGYPTETNEWSSLATTLFYLMSAGIILATTICSSTYFFKSGVFYLDRKINST